MSATAGARTRFGWPVYAWGLWDWGSAAFNAVITTFVFSVYLASDSFGDDSDVWIGVALAIAGVLIAVLAPVTGQGADRSGRRTFWLGFHTVVVVLLSAAMFFVQPDRDYLWLGLVLLASGSVFFELASVNYNAMLNQISTPATVGRVSGLGWGLGYLGGIVLLLIVYVGLIAPEVGVFGITGTDALDVRVTMLVCAGWTLLFSLPVLLTIRDPRRSRERRPPRLSVADSYRRLFASIGELWREDRNTVYFLGAAAVFRDGLAGVFTFGAILAAGTFGFSDGGVIVFAIGANVVAGLATVAAGVLDDRIGPKRVIVGSLLAMTVAGVALFVLHTGGSAVFWVFGLVLAGFVGPAQSAARTFLARLIPAGREGQVFGLYATTGRAVSFLAPAAYSTAVVLGGAQYYGILGILAVLVTGLLLLLPVRAGRRPPQPTAVA